MSARYDCCPVGVHREDELCSRTAVQMLPPADEPAPEAETEDERGGAT